MTRGLCVMAVVFRVFGISCFCIEYCYKCMVSGVVCTYFLLG